MEFFLTLRARIFLRPAFVGEESLATLPQFEPVRSASGLLLPIPAETPRVSATPSLRGFAGEPVPHPLPGTDSRECWPMVIHLRRSFLRFRPSASRSGRGVADESLTWLRTASRTHEPHQQVGTPRVATADPKTGSQCSASGDKLGEASHRLRC